MFVIAFVVVNWSIYQIIHSQFLSQGNVCILDIFLVLVLVHYKS